MTDQITGGRVTPEPSGTMLESGGLRFEISFRGPAGATLRVYGDVDGQKTELLRFDDFIDGPHYHVPADGPAIAFDQTELGEPLTWFVAEVRHNLRQLLTTAGFAAILPEIDLESVSRDADRIRLAMEDCVPAGYIRIPGVGLQRAGGEQ